MPHPRTPEAKAKLTGAIKNHPERFRERSEPELSDKPIGKAPKYFTAIQVKAWDTFVDEIGWLIYEDRGALEVCALMRAKLMEDTDQPASFFGNYRMALSSLGATPVDRSKVHQPAKEPKEADPFAQFGNVN